MSGFLNSGPWSVVRRLWLKLAMIGYGLLAMGYSSSHANTPTPYGLETRLPCKPYLSMPSQANGAVPTLLSETGVFKDTANLVPNSELIPYDLVVSFWSDGAAKSRWMAAPFSGGSSPTEKIKFRPTGEWTFPKGTVFIKHFELPTDETDPATKRRLETRLLVCDRTGGVYGVTYKWRADNTDAELLYSNLTEKITIRTATGARTQTWYYPSRDDCRTCHTPRAGGVLGPKTRQLNRLFTYQSALRSADGSSPRTDNQLRAWNHIGLFDPPMEAGTDALPASSSTLPSYTALAAAEDDSRSLEDRGRSYLDANCAHCHRPGGTILDFDTRYDVPLAQQGLINGQVLIDEGLDNPRLIAPRDSWRSVMLMRVNTLEGLKMPPLAHLELDQRAIALLRHWIESMPGKAVVPPPTFSSHGGHFAQPVALTLTESESGAEIHYTLDGSVPDKSDPVYDKPIVLKGPTVVRAKAFKTGFTRSITAQEVFVVGE